MAQPELITVTPENVAKTGFFCKMSARGKPGYEQKLAWLERRFDEGLQLRLLGDGERGFVEFIPGAHAWRAIENADEYIVIHCLWVVGRSKGKGFSRVLLDDVASYARANGFKGVAAVTSSRNWLIDKGVLEHNGYVCVGSAPPSFNLLVLKFDADAEDPRFCGGWDRKLSANPEGMVVYRTAQCPYLDDAVQHARSYADDAGIAFREVVLETAEDVRRYSPTPYGVFAIVLDGRLLSYNYMLTKDFPKAIAKAG